MDSSSGVTKFCQVVGLEAANGDLTVPVPTQGSLIMVRCKHGYFKWVFSQSMVIWDQRNQSVILPFFAYRLQILTRNKKVKDKMRLCPDLIDICTSH